MNEIDRAVSAFMGAWERRDWPKMLASLQVRRRTRTTAKRLHAMFGDLDVRRWTILGEPRVRSVARVIKLEERFGITPEARDVSVNVLYRYGRSLLSQRLELVVVRENAEGEPPLPNERGTWGVNELSALRGRHASGGQVVRPDEAAEALA